MPPNRVFRHAVSFTPYPAITPVQLMAFYASSSPERPEHEHPQLTISEPSSPSTSRIDDDSFLSTDLDVSFASVSVSSVPGTPTEEQSYLLSVLAHHQDAMDISPAPPRRIVDKFDRPTAARRRSKTVSTEPLHLEQGPSPEDRLFGREVSNTGTSPTSPPKAPAIIRNIKASPQPSPVPSLFDGPSDAAAALSSGRRRAGLPTAWIQQPRSKRTSPKRASGIFAVPEGLPIDSSPEKSVFSDAMELDKSVRKPSSVPFVTSSPPRPAEDGDDDGFGSLFFGSNSPALIANRKRRSLEDEERENRTVHRRGTSIGGLKDTRSSSGGPFGSSSPGYSPSALRKPTVPGRQFERYATTGSTGAFLFGGITKGSSGKKGAPKRPGIQPFAGSPSSKAPGPKSAYAGLYGPNSRRVPSTMSTMPMPRRAISAQVPPTLATNMVNLNSPEKEDADAETEPEDESFEANASSPAPPPRKGGPFRSISYAHAPLSAAPGMSMFSKLQEAMSGVAASKDDDEWTSVSHGAGAALLGSRDNETHGKILPCHAVKDDGIVRITPQTMEDLLAGDYDEHIREFHIIDCRFDYEYEGGHIPGAVNLKSPEDVEHYFLEEVEPPAPTQSGEEPHEGEGRTIIVFHCEFSAKRGPTFAKHLRAQDRKRCSESYPKVHYPEVYILEGGYKAYFESFPYRCSGYTTMDDPDHLEARREKIDNLRRWERTKSYTYGERVAAASALSAVNKASSGASRAPALPKAKPAVPRRTANGASSGRLELSTLMEHHEADSFCSNEGDSSFDGVGDSPCLVVKTRDTFATVRPFRAPRAPLERASTLGQLAFGAR